MNASTYWRLARWEYPNLPKATTDPQATGLTSALWSPEDCAKCIKWIEETKTALLDPEERAWMSAAISSSTWKKNMALYLEILLIEVSENEAVDATMTKNFDRIVERLIEETYASPDSKISDTAPASPLDSELLLKPALVSFANELIGSRNLKAPLTLAEITQILRSRFIQPSASRASIAEPVDVGELCRQVGCKKLTELQRQINTTLSGMQEITANINTDFRQARTGF